MEDKVGAPIVAKATFVVTIKYGILLDHIVDKAHRDEWGARLLGANVNSSDLRAMIFSDLGVVLARNCADN